NVPLQILAGSPVIENSVVDGAFNAIMISGSSKPLIRNNQFTNATASAMVLSEQAQPSLKGNQFTENQPFHIQNSSSYAIKVTGNTFDPPASMMTILGPMQD
ncbi:MAG: right-handed parallel beta-helix repeat-containing protein, partial [Pseudomonadales bacterium]